VENIAGGFAHCPEANLAVIAAGILPDQNRPREDPRGIVETETAFVQCLGVLCLIPFEFHRG